MGRTMRAGLKWVAARAFAKAAFALRAQPERHSGDVRGQAGFDGICRLLSACEGDAAVGLLRQYGARFGERCVVHSGVLVHNAQEDFGHLVIGHQVHIGPGVLLDLADRIVIGDRVTIAMRSMLITHADAGDACSEWARRLKRRAPIRLESDVYLGAGCTILPGVTVGEGALVAAGALVNRDVAAGEAVAGVPARPIHR
jgi:acetyltransferase-like isoleucine patch superfamily enzyme